MKKFVALFIVIAALTQLPAQAQRNEVGIGFGVSNSLTDLGGAFGEGTSFLKDMEFSLFRPAACIFYRANLNDFISLKTQLAVGGLAGNDALANYTNEGDPAFWRYQRNLHFKSPVVDFTQSIEIHLKRYMHGDRQKRWAPYLTFGVGVFYFNPKAEYNDQWIKLQPIGTEGQGLPGYDDPYSRLGINLSYGLGFKYNLNWRWAIGLELTGRKTFTDYIDDVSGFYPLDADVIAGKDPADAALTLALSDRSPELGVESNSYGDGSGRGNPDRNDAYFFTFLTISMNFSSSGKIACPTYNNSF